MYLFMINVKHLHENKSMAKYIKIIKSLNPLLHIGCNSVPTYGHIFDFEIRRGNKKFPMGAASMSR